MNRLIQQINMSHLFASSELGKKSTLHIAEQCFSSFGVSLIFPQNSVYAKLFNDAILRFSASGLDLKIANDMAWDLQRTDTKQLMDQIKGKSFSMSDVEERKLNLADTEGMFLLMAVGYVMAGSVLFSEIVGGCAKSCRAVLRRGSVAAGRRGSTSSLSQVQPEEPKTFSEKLKRGIRRRLRPKAKPEKTDDQSVVVETNGDSKPAETGEPDAPVETSKPEETGLKGPTSFCTLKRIMLMRKRRKEEKKAAQKELEAAIIETAKIQQTSLDNHAEPDEGAVAGEQVIIENEKTGTIEDAGSLTESSSIYSDNQIIKEETEAEVNQCASTSSRENNPSTEFGEIV